MYCSINVPNLNLKKTLSNHEVLLLYGRIRDRGKNAAHQSFSLISAELHIRGLEHETKAEIYGAIPPISIIVVYCRTHVAVPCFVQKIKWYLM